MSKIQIISLVFNFVIQLRLSNLILSNRYKIKMEGSFEIGKKKWSAKHRPLKNFKVIALILGKKPSNFRAFQI
jgi:hypothetical protein